MQRLIVNGILSYPHLFQPHAVVPGAEPKYSVTVLIPKSDTVTTQSVINAIESEKSAGFPNGFPANGRTPLRDMAQPKDDGSMYPEKFHNYHELRTSTGANNKPGIIDWNKQTVIDTSLVYPGVIAHVSVNIASYNNVNKGVSAYLNAVMLTDQMGELGRLDNIPTVEELFADVKPQQTQQSAVTASPVSSPIMRQMTPAATASYEDYIAAGWTDEQLKQHGLMI